MKNKKPTLEQLDNLLIEGTKFFKKKYGIYHPHLLKMWVNERLEKENY